MENSETIRTINEKDLFDHSPTPTLCISEHGEIMEANKTAVNLFQIDKQILLTKPIITLIADDYKRKLNTFLYETRLQKSYQCNIDIKLRNGETIPVQLNSRPIFINNNYNYTILSVNNISEQKNIEDSLIKTKEELQYLAHHDPLTHLPNRYLLEDRLQNALNRTKRNGWLGAVVFADVDRFKVINDDYGHHIGDEVLRTVSQRLTKMVRAQDTVCRYSGDEFILILEDITCEKDAAQVIQKILNLFEKPISGLIDSPLKVSTSIGVSLFDKFDNNIENLIKKADYAMYESKKRGRNCYTFYSAEHSLSENLDMIMENELSVAFSENQFELYFQPQVNTTTNKIESVEVLTRWHHPTRGMLQPAEFIQRIENANLSNQMSRWVLEEASKIAQQWLNEGYDFKYLAINITPRELGSYDLVSLIKDVLRDSDLPAEKLEIELTETSIMQNPNLASKLMHDLQSMGIRLSLDDFGTGYSALSHLNDYPFNGIKIDKSFIENLPFDKKSSVLVDAIISIAQSIGIGIIAEGVELPEQKTYLNEKGCELMQGYLFSKPVNVEKMSEMLSKEKQQQQPVVKLVS